MNVRSTALIDGDELVYKVGYGCEHTYYNLWSYRFESLVNEFTNKKEADKYVKSFSEGKDIFFIQPVKKILPEKTCLYNINVSINFILEKSNCEECIIFFSSEDNFRDNISSITPYKENRDNTKRPYYYDMITNYIKDKYTTISVSGYEADDLLAIYYNMIDFYREGKAVIVTQDKDLLQVPGYFLNLGTKAHLEYGKEGTVFYIKEEEGIKNFYIQLYNGDTIDCIPGFKEITGKNKTKKVVEKIKEQKYTSDIEQVLYKLVKLEYLKALKAKDTEDIDCILWEIGNLLHIHRSYSDLGWVPPVSYTRRKEFIIDDRWKKKGHVHEKKENIPDVCPVCQGKGYLEDELEDCPTCNGEGVLYG